MAQRMEFTGGAQSQPEQQSQERRKVTVEAESPSGSGTRKPAGWLGRQLEKDAIAAVIIGLFVKILERIFNSVEEKITTEAAERVVKVIHEPPRNRLTDIIYIQMPEEQTKNLRRWLRKGDKDHTEGQMVELICKLFNHIDPPPTDEVIMQKFRELDQRGYRNFKEVLRRLKHDNAEQALYRLGEKGVEVAKGTFHVAEATVEKTVIAIVAVGLGTKAAVTAAGKKVEDITRQCIPTMQRWNEKLEADHKAYLLRKTAKKAEDIPHPNARIGRVQ
ncbi:MAG TPA: hypothetical protein VNG29_02820 [Candidatus Paceibacterota bacterium]|nr:hypothetical protein [Candidatus Paceibacterota bacterium]